MTDPEPDQDDPLWKVLNEHYNNVTYLYQQYATKRPVMLFDVQEQRAYAYPCRGFAADLPKNPRHPCNSNTRPPARRATWSCSSGTTWNGGWYPTACPSEKHERNATP